MRLSLHRSTLGFRSVLRTAHGAISARELIEVTLTDDEGLRGVGEAAPLEPYDGVSVRRALDALRAYERVVAEPPPGLLLLDACRAVDELPQAIAAIDMALWDLTGRRAGRAVCELLTDSPAGAVAVNASIDAAPPAEAAAAAE